MWSLIVGERYPQGHREAEIEGGQSVADQCEADDVVSLFLDEDSYQDHVQDHTLH